MKQLILLIAFALAQILFAQSDEVLKYESRVSARIIPVFAIDGKGGPVYDLKKEEIQFAVNGRKISLDYFIKRDFTSQSTVLPESKEPAAIPLASQERIIFIVIDCSSLSHSAEQRTKQIVSSLVRNGKRLDRYVLVLVHDDFGLKYITGPEPNSPSLLKKIVALWSTNLSGGGPSDDLNRGYDVFESDVTKRNPESIPNDLKNMIGKPMGLGIGSNLLTKSILSLRFGINIFVQPKLVYFLSAGFPLQINDPDDLGSHRMVDNVQLIAAAFRQSGATVFAINPNQTASELFKESLLYVASETGGEYIQSPDIQRIVERVEKMNSAYYEAVFNLNVVMPAKEYNIKANCSRPGVKILVPSQINEGKQYPELSSFEKELFAVDAISSGLWSKMIARIKKAPFSTQLFQANGSQKIKVTVTIPFQMETKEADVFIVHIQKKTGDVKIDKFDKFLQASEELLLTPQDTEKQSFAFVCKDGTYCICANME